MATKKKTGNVQTLQAAETIAVPTEYTIGGTAYRLIPRDEWSGRQDDYAVAILAELAMERAQAAEQSEEGTSLRDMVRALIESGLYRRMLGVSMQPVDGDPINVGESALKANIERFNVKFGDAASQEIFAAAMGAVASFFGSAKS